MIRQQYLSIVTLHPRKRMTQQCPLYLQIERPEQESLLAFWYVFVKRQKLGAFSHLQTDKHFEQVYKRNDLLDKCCVFISNRRLVISMQDIKKICASNVLPSSLVPFCGNQSLTKNGHPWFHYNDIDIAMFPSRVYWLLTYIRRE